MKIGVIGYSDKKFDVVEARRLIELGLDTFQATSKDEVVSGLTNIGIPKIAYEVATERDMTTVGIACDKAKDYECFKVDRKFIIGTEWGDESGHFLKYIDVLIKVGGGVQSVKEFEAFKGPKKEYDLPIITESKVREALTK